MTMKEYVVPILSTAAAVLLAFAAIKAWEAYDRKRKLTNAAKGNADRQVVAEEQTTD